MYKIDTDKLEEGLMITGRNAQTTEALLVRTGVHSFTNHNAMVVKATQSALDYMKDIGQPTEGIEVGDFCIAEAKPPFSTLSSIASYEAIMNDGVYLVRFYRIKTLKKEQSALTAAYFVRYLLGLPYPRKCKMILLAMPIYNAIIDRINIAPSIRLTWCSQLVKEAFTSQDANCLDGVKGYKKSLFTPKTFENRIMFGIFEDVTDSILIKQIDLD